jgi:hypothetical protein
VRFQAQRLLFDLARSAVEDDPDSGDATPLAEMSPAQKAALLARLDKALGEDEIAADPTSVPLPPRAMDSDQWWPRRGLAD